MLNVIIKHNLSPVQYIFLVLLSLRKRVYNSCFSTSITIER